MQFPRWLWSATKHITPASTSAISMHCDVKGYIDVQDAGSATPSNWKMLTAE
jgi:hypothetical protein